MKKGFEEALPLFELWEKKKYSVQIFAPTQTQLDRIQFLLEQRNLPLKKATRVSSFDEPGIFLKEGFLPEGFRWAGAKNSSFSVRADFLGTQKTAKKTRKPREDSSAQEKTWSDLQVLTDLNVGDLVVHADHGIGRYLGIAKLTLNAVENEFISLEYANKDKLYLPVYRVNVIQKYMGSGGSEAILDRLGSKDFEKEKEAVKTAVRKIAFDLIQLYAERQHSARNSALRRRLRLQRIRSGVSLRGNGGPAESHQCRPHRISRAGE